VVVEDGILGVLDVVGWFGIGILMAAEAGEDMGHVEGRSLLPMVTPSS
jgi:hypothetical protein